MVKSTNYLNAFVGFCWILLQVSNSLSEDLSQSVVQIFSGQDYLCSGTLVENNFVVTSAECLAQPRNLTILTVVGNVLRNETTPDDESTVSKIFTPPEFSTKRRHMDVAVLKLENSIAGSKIKPTDLCRITRIEAGNPVTLFYWNLRKYVPRNKSVDFKLRTLHLSVVDDTVCAESYGEKYSDTMFCAAEPHRNYFFFDRGGPATIAGQFCGIFQYGDNNLKKTVPGSLTSLANPEVMQFIKESLLK